MTMYDLGSEKQKIQVTLVLGFPICVLKYVLVHNVESIYDLSNDMYHH